MSAIEDAASVDLYWIPLGAGEAPAVVRWTGRVFESLAARRAHRAPCDLYHSALEVRIDGHRHVIEMAPVWGVPDARRGVAGEGAVGLPWLGRSRLFRYEVRCWCDGTIPDIAYAVASPVRVSRDRQLALALLHLVPSFPTCTWGRDEQGTGEMWNSNSLTSWLLAGSGHDMDQIVPPPHGRAPGWSAGMVVAARAADATHPSCTDTTR
jgi:hypothetical protein